MRVGEANFFFARDNVNLEGQILECVAIKSSVDEEVEYIALDSLDDEGYMRGGLADATLKWMYKKARKPYVPHEPYRVWLANVVRMFAESAEGK